VVRRSETKIVKRTRQDKTGLEGRAERSLFLKRKKDRLSAKGKTQ